MAHQICKYSFELELPFFGIIDRVTWMNQMFIAPVGPNPLKDVRIALFQTATKGGTSCLPHWHRNLPTRIQPPVALNPKKVRAWVCFNEFRHYRTSDLSTINESKICDSLP